MVPFVQAELLWNHGEPDPVCGTCFLFFFFFSSHFYGMLSKEPKEGLRDAPNIPKYTKLSNRLLTAQLDTDFKSILKL